MELLAFARDHTLDHLISKCERNAVFRATPATQDRQGYRLGWAGPGNGGSDQRKTTKTESPVISYTFYMTVSLFLSLFLVNEPPEMTSFPGLL